MALQFLCHLFPIDNDRSFSSLRERLVEGSTPMWKRRAAEPSILSTGRAAGGAATFVPKTKKSGQLTGRCPEGAGTRIKPSGNLVAPLWLVSGLVLLTTFRHRWTFTLLLLRMRLSLMLLQFEVRVESVLANIAGLFVSRILGHGKFSLGSAI